MRPNRRLDVHQPAVVDPTDRLLQFFAGRTATTVEAEAPESETPSKAAWIWFAPFLLLVSAIVAIPLQILEEEGLPRYRRLQESLAHIEASNEGLASEVRSLEREVEMLRQSPEAIERVARDELGMIRSDEIVFQFPEDL